jgi:2-aminobenzoate-CoA ligase
VLKKIAFFSAPNTIDRNQNLDELARAKPITFKACDTSRDDVALIAFTSGTTGVPKGTMHYHSDVLAMCDLFPRHVLKPTSSDVFCGTPPLAFTFGLGGMLAFPLRVGASTLLLEGLTPEKLLLSIAKHKATVCFTAPTFYRQMALLIQASPKKFDMRSLIKCVSAGEALPDATRTLWHQATGLEMIDGIGATEMIHIFIASAGEEVKPGAIGKVVPGYEAKIVDEKLNDLQELPRGRIGRLAVRGPTGCKYLADDRQKVYVKNGWNLTGDTFLQDEEGYFVYQARSDDMIISAGYNIAGPEVEAALLQHPAVAECGVVGAADEERGQIVKAFIVLKPGHVADDQTIVSLQTFVKENIAPYKYPRAIEFVAALPRTETDKLQRFKLKAM